jgi:tetratricopeptide (TPR) repeat protein
MDGQPSHFRNTLAVGLGLAMLFSLMFLQTARAADSEASLASDGTESPAYRRAIKEGLAEYAALHFEEARSLFRRAHEINPNARTFRGLGMTSFELRDYVAAVRNLSAALKDSRKPLSPEQRKSSQDLLDRSRMLVDAYSLTVSPRNARVLIDGREPELDADRTLLLGVGLHNLEVSASGMIMRSLPINVRGGERKDLSVTLEQAFAASEQPSDAVRIQQGNQAKPASKEVSNTAATAWLLAGGGAALLSAGFGVYWAMQESQLNACHNPADPSRLCDVESTLKTQRNFGIGATVVTGAAALTMGLVGILSWHSAPSDTKKHSALDCTVSPFGITCGGVF